MTSTFLQVRHRISNTPIHDTMAYDLSLEIRECVGDRLCGSDGFHVLPLGDRFFPPGESWHAHIPLTKEQVYNIVEEAVRTWHDVVIHRDIDVNRTSRKLFQHLWDLSDHREVLKTIGPDVARAGAKMHYQLFEKGASDLDRLIDTLRRAMRKQPLKIRIISREFFVPWGLIFTETDPDASPDSIEFWEGFWGARHLIDHETGSIGPRITINGDEKISTSLAVDDNLTVDSDGSDMKWHVQFFEDTPSLETSVWRNKLDLETGLRPEYFCQAILYFCCHGSGDNEPPSIRLTDQEPINAGDIDWWLQRGVLKSHPVVFLNACEGGVMQTRFYETIAPQFLKREAAGLVGAHTKLPTLFATRYAQDFFRELLRTDRPPQRIGPLMRGLTRRFIMEYANPLGLVYALYRASDVYIDRPRQSVLEQGSLG